MQFLHVLSRIIALGIWIGIKDALVSLHLIKPASRLNGMSDQIQEFLDNKHAHRWSGWPGAFCLKCGREDPYEMAMADGWIDFVENPDDPTGAYLEKWDSEEHRLFVEKANNCLIPD